MFSYHSTSSKHSYCSFSPSIHSFAGLLFCWIYFLITFCCFFIIVFFIGALRTNGLLRVGFSTARAILIKFLFVLNVGNSIFSHEVAKESIPCEPLLFIMEERAKLMCITTSTSTFKHFVVEWMIHGLKNNSGYTLLYFQ